MAKPLYVSATCKDSGKTSLVCGLYQALQQRDYDVGYYKPVGQHYISYGGKYIDRDAVLMRDAFGLTDDPEHLNPITIKRGFTTDFLQDPDTESLEAKILECFNTLSQKHETLIIEGTGHAGVGSCLGLCNARVAKLLGAEVIIVATGGIGRPIDELALSLALFRQFGVEVAGVILNKVFPQKFEKVYNAVSSGLERLGTKLLGAIPYETDLGHYTIEQIADEFGYSVLCGEESLSNRVEQTVVAAMEPQNIIKHIREKSLIITPGDRVDNILLAIILCENKNHKYGKGSGGLILTGGLKPHASVFFLLADSNIPVLMAEEDTFQVCSRMKGLELKMRASDTHKIKATHRLVQQHVDINHIISIIEK